MGDEHHSVLPEGSAETRELLDHVKHSRNILEAVVGVLSAIFVIVVGGLILKLIDVTSARSTELNDKAHAFAAMALTAETRFARAANDQKAAAQLVSRAMLAGDTSARVLDRLGAYDRAVSEYQAATYDLIRLVDGGDAHHFQPAEFADLHHYLRLALDAADRHQDCLSRQASHYLAPGSHAAASRPDRTACVDGDGRVYDIETELHLLDSCEAGIERRIYDMSDSLTSAGWRAVESAHDEREGLFRERRTQMGPWCPTGLKSAVLKIPADSVWLAPRR